jgi:hypothetical protein
MNRRIREPGTATEWSSSTNGYSLTYVLYIACSYFSVWLPLTKSLTRNGPPISLNGSGVFGGVSERDKGDRGAGPVRLNIYSILYGGIQ